MHGVQEVNATGNYQTDLLDRFGRVQALDRKQVVRKNANREAFCFILSRKSYEGRSGNFNSTDTRVGRTFNLKLKLDQYVGSCCQSPLGDDDEGRKNYVNALKIWSSLKREQEKEAHSVLQQNPRLTIWRQRYIKCLRDRWRECHRLWNAGRQVRFANFPDQPISLVLD